jgi:transcriptional regulator with GAF, ATPase, and Fis domain
MDKNEFFRQATLRICGNLEIEEAMQDLLHFLKEFLPVTKLYLQHYDHEYHAMRSIAFADEAECAKLDMLIPLSKTAGEMAGSLSTTAGETAGSFPPTDQEIFLLEDPQAIPVSHEITKFYGSSPTSLIVLALKTGGNMLGYLILISDDKEKFTDEHLNSVLMLKEPFFIAMANTLKHRQVLKLNDLLTDDNRYLHRELRRLSGDEIIGADFGLRQAMHKVQQVASLDSPVLLLGETGTGKDVLANFIHSSSSRSSGPFVGVNCGAIPDTLIDSELFGHEKGAFTGALSQKRGRFERAHKGTIFLDEIGELPPKAQVRLLRVLQNKEIERVGGVKTIPIDIRIIAATNRNLEEMVEKQDFREDLWFRLNVFPIWIPPLRDRQMDISALIQHFINLKSKELKLPATPALAPGAIDPLMAYRWPGNVRELENVIERELILNPTGPLTFENLNYGRQKKTVRPHPENTNLSKLDDIISHHIRRVLSETKGKVNGSDGAAAILGINPNTLRNRMKKLGIEYGRKKKL